MAINYWTQKTVVITGGSAGLGFAIAQQLAEREANVVLLARDNVRLEQAAEQLRTKGPVRVTTFALDICQDGMVSQAVAAIESSHGPAHALFNVAGCSDRGLASKTSLDRYRELWELNFLASVRCTQMMLPQLLANRGHVVHTGSLAAKIAPRFMGAYPTSKFPLAAFSQQLRLEHATEGLHVLFACPGPLARRDAGQRYATQTTDLPPAARQPGAGAKVRPLEPAYVAQRMLQACERRDAELILPAKAKWLFALSQLWPAWGDRLLLGRSA